MPFRVELISKADDTQLLFRIEPLNFSMIWLAVMSTSLSRP